MLKSTKKIEVNLLEIVEKLIEIRKSKGLTQTEVANALGWSRQLISYRENGIRNLKVSTLVKWANIYGYKVSLVEMSDAEKIAYRRS